MTPTSALREDGGAVLLNKLGWRATLPVLLLLLAQVGLFVWMAPRGFDFTDESYYFLNYLYWRDLIGTVTFFGAYFEWPFRILGQSVAAIRIFGLLLLLVTSAFFSREALRFISRRDGFANDAPLVFVATNMATALLYFGYLSTLRAPSYNLLALCSMLVATGLLLRLLEPSRNVGNRRLAMLAYGLALGVCGLAKASSGALTVVGHILFFTLANRDWRVNHLLELVILSLVGVSLNFLVLQWVHPEWMTVLREGVSIGRTTDGRSLVGLLGWDSQALAPVLLLLFIGALGVFIGLVRWVGPARKNILSTLVVVLIGCCTIGLMWESQARRWLPSIALVVLMLWSIESLRRDPIRLTRDDAIDLGLMCILFGLPIAFSYGTNMAVLEHSQKAGVFAITAIILRLHRLFRLGFLTIPAIAACLTMLCIPTLVIQLKAALDVRYTYRQLSALGEQTIPFSVGVAKDTMFVDAITRETLQSLDGLLSTTGFVPGQTILDFTGDGPGLVYVLGGRPLGVAWLPGGYPGSNAAGVRLITQLSAQQLSSAWLLSSNDNPRAIQNWQQHLNERLGMHSHELAATIYIRSPYRWGNNAPSTIDVQLWKPQIATTKQ